MPGYYSPKTRGEGSVGNSSGNGENKGSYEATATINKVKIHLYGKDLKQLTEDFEREKERVRRETDYRSGEITLKDWFETWFTNVKSHRIKETSVAPMKNSFKRSFSFYIGTMKLKQIRPLDIQQAINTMEQEKVSIRTIRDALGRLRECMEFAVGNQMINYNPCTIVEVPWSYQKAKTEIALTQEEQDRLLAEMENHWYKELFYFMCLTGVRVGELGGLKWKDIDFEKQLISIQRSLSCSYCDGVKREMLVSPKTINSTRTIPFIGEMEHQIAEKETDRLEKGAGRPLAQQGRTGRTRLYSSPYPASHLCHPLF